MSACCVFGVCVWQGLAAGYSNQSLLAHCDCLLLPAVRSPLPKPQHDAAMLASSADCDMHCVMPTAASSKGIVMLASSADCDNATCAPHHTGSTCRGTQGPDSVRC